MKRKTTLLIISTSSALILGLWLGAWYVGTEQTVIRQFTSQPLADVFSSINALFAGFLIFLLRSEAVEHNWFNLFAVYGAVLYLGFKLTRTGSNQRHA